MCRIATVSGAFFSVTNVGVLPMWKCCQWSMLPVGRSVVVVARERDPPEGAGCRVAPPRWRLSM